jgi:8-oxo-dGTP pyrophosphatase MutT (NUDIX family)
MFAWEILASRPLFSRPPWLTLWEEDVRLPNGHEIKGYLRAVSRDYAIIYAQLADGTVPLVRQYKRGADQPLYDLPAGYLDSPDEPPLEAAQRELREETGLTAARWQCLGHLIVDSNRGDTRAHLYLAADVTGDGAQELDETEEINVSYHTPAELRSMIARGEIETLATVACIASSIAILGKGD